MNMCVPAKAGANHSKNKTLEELLHFSSVRSLTQRILSSTGSEARAKCLLSFCRCIKVKKKMMMMMTTTIDD